MYDVKQCYFDIIFQLCMMLNNVILISFFTDQHNNGLAEVAQTPSMEVVGSRMNDLLVANSHWSLVVGLQVKQTIRSTILLIFFD